VALEVDVSQQRTKANRMIDELGVWHLTRVSMLESVDANALREFSRLLRLREFKRGETVYVVSGSRDEHLERIYFLLKGSVKLCCVDDESSKELLLVLIKPHEPFGLLDSVANEKTDLRAVAMTASLVAYVPRPAFDRIIENSGACTRLVKLIGERSVQVVARFEDLAFQSVPVRLARILLRLARDFPRQRECGTSIDVPLTQQEIANLIGARREVVSTHLTRLKQEGTLAFHTDAICIHDYAALQALSQ